MSSGQEQARVTLEAWLVTDVGVVRDHNEDSAFMEATKGFFIVADGMGGHAAGEVASAMAVETVRTTLDAARTEIDAFKKAPTDAGRRAIVQLLQSAVLSAHQAVFQRGQSEQDKAGMGTTLDVVLVAGPEAFVAHVGDSRTYLVREGRSSQITTDHTVAEVLVIEGKLTIEEAQVSPLRTILVNAIGVSADVGVEMAHVTLKKGDRLLLCSDGLHDYFPVEEEIAQKLSADQPGDALKDMVELAKQRGGHDNITGVAIHVTDLVEGVPAEVGGESTQPVDLAGNPFAADEPTETALSPTTTMSPPKLPIGLTPPVVTPTSLKATQPMRAVSDEDMAGDTIPPPDKRAIERMPTDPPKDKKDEEAPTEPAKTEAKPEEQDKDKDTKNGDAKVDEAPAKEKKSKSKKKKGKKADEAKVDDKDKDKDKDEEDDEDSAPSEIANADTGRVAIPPKEPGAS
jgi:serine/threonine protein phosphatase PrpC